jgi:hypothetical protein
MDFASLVFLDPAVDSPALDAYIARSCKISKPVDGKVVTTRAGDGS